MTALLRFLWTGNQDATAIGETNNIIGTTNTRAARLANALEKSTADMTDVTPRVHGVTLSASAWTGGETAADGTTTPITQTVANTGWAGATIAVMPPQTADEAAAFATAGVFAVKDDSTGAVTFTATTGVKPETDITCPIFVWSVTPTQATVTLPAADWQDWAQDVTVPGLAWHDNWVTAADADSAVAWATAGVFITHTAAGRLHAECVDTPAQDINVLVTIFPGPTEKESEDAS